MNSKKTKMFTMRLSEEDFDMMQSLKSHPHFFDIAEFFRTSLRNAYKVKTERLEKQKVSEEKDVSDE